jgi:excisionase family DNA binding protein
METQLLSVAQFACCTGVSITTIYRKVQKGLIPSVDVAGQVRIPVWYLEELTSRPGELPIWLASGKETSDE